MNRERNNKEGGLGGMLVGGVFVSLAIGGLTGSSWWLLLSLGITLYVIGFLTAILYR